MIDVDHGAAIGAGVVVVVVVVVVGVGAGTTGAIVGSVVVVVPVGFDDTGGAVVDVAVVLVDEASTVGSVCVWSRPGAGGFGVGVEVVVVVGGGVVDATSVVVFESVVFFCLRFAVALDFVVGLRLAERCAVAAPTLDGDAPPELPPDPELVAG